MPEGLTAVRPGAESAPPAAVPAAPAVSEPAKQIGDPSSATRPTESAPIATEGKPATFRIGDKDFDEPTISGWRKSSEEAEAIRQTLDEVKDFVGMDEGSRQVLRDLFGYLQDREVGPRVLEMFEQALKKPDPKPLPEEPAERAAEETRRAEAARNDRLDRMEAALAASQAERRESEWRGTLGGWKKEFAEKYPAADMDSCFATGSLLSQRLKRSLTKQQFETVVKDNHDRLEKAFGARLGAYQKSLEERGRVVTEPGKGPTAAPPSREPEPGSDDEFADMVRFVQGQAAQRR